MTSIISRLIAVCLMLFAVTACAGKPVFHSFDFGTSGENKDVEILNYKYGNSKLTATQAPAWELTSGHIEQGNGISGIFPVGDFLYVKWRTLSTGKVYEDTVDLRSRLPLDMENKRIHFFIKGSQLYVYLISDRGHLLEGPDCPVHLYRDFGCTELYPEHWKNF